MITILVLHYLPPKQSPFKLPENTGLTTVNVSKSSLQDNIRLENKLSPMVFPESNDISFYKQDLKRVITVDSDHNGWPIHHHIDLTPVCLLKKK